MVRGDGGERGGSGHTAAGLGQTAGPARGQLSGDRRLLHPHPLRRNLPNADRAVVHPLLLLWETQIPSRQDPACLSPASL